MKGSYLTYISPLDFIVNLIIILVGFCRDRSKTTARMKPWQGYVHACVVALSVWFCRETIFEALQWWNGRSPSDGLLLGFCILLTGLACVPIVAIHFSHILVCIYIYIYYPVFFIVYFGSGDHTISIANFWWSLDS